MPSTCFVAAALLRTLTCADTTAAPGDTARPSLAVTVVDRRPTIDGRLNEALWSSEPAASHFTQVDPRDGATPSERTEVRIAYDRDAIYVGVRLFDSQASHIVSRLSRRDGQTSSDAFTISLDSYHDHRTAFRFTVNAAGVKSDELVSNDADDGDASWDPVWDAAASIDSAGWSVEMRIPLSQLRFGEQNDQTWGANFTRYIARTGEILKWSWAPRSQAGAVSLYGHLTGFRELGGTQSHRIEITPYAITQGDLDNSVASGDPFRSSRSGHLSGGADLKLALTSGLTLNATVNPDFGQVEADPAEVNISIFETYFQERRPFFVEGSNLFTFGAGANGQTFAAPTLFYSRRIGRAPTASAPRNARFADVPEITRIRAAGKISGQTHGWSTGLLYALTAREQADFQMDDGSRGLTSVEPRTHYAVASLRRDGNSSGIGFFGTGVWRDIDTTSLNFLRSSAHTGGIDFFHRFGPRYSIDGSLSASHLQGDSSSIISVMRSPAHYYQRPDQDYVRVDSSARALSGYAATLSGGKVSGNWIFISDFFANSPGYDVNDIGFQGSSDRIFHGVRATRRWLKPSRLFLTSSAYVTESMQWNFGGSRIAQAAFAGASGQLHNRWNVSVNSQVNAAALSDRLTRGGPMFEAPSFFNVGSNISSDNRRRVTGSLSTTYVRNSLGGDGRYASVSLGMRPTPAASISFTPSYSQARSIFGYVTAPLDAFATGMYGRRYITANQTQRTLDLTTRGEVALTPNLSLQLYLQPFISAVENGRFKALGRAGSNDYLVYGRDNGSTISYDDAERTYTADADGTGPAPALTFANPDFRLRSLRVNAVVRWEFSPGSTLYFAWAHGRQIFMDDAAFDVSHDLSDLLHDDHRDRLVLKVSYWINP